MRQTKILIVDDRPENLLTLESLLDEPGVELVRALSGDEALALTLDHDFALVLLDVQMPGMDGYEVAELMRGNKKTKGVPIIFVTANGMDDHHLFKGYGSGAVDYLVKPLNPMILKGKAHVFIELHRQKEELQQKTIELDRKLVELEELQQQLEEMNEQLLVLSITDGLTGLLNRRQFDAIFADEWGRALRHQWPLSIVMVDIDYFKAYNDTYGHAMGDDCLIKVAQALAAAVKRDVDRVARIGGEEFALILPDTDREGADHVAETIRRAVEELKIDHAGSSAASYVSVSAGGATIIPQNKTAPRMLIQVADDALYKAKLDGRNQVHGMYCKIPDEPC